MNDVRIYRRHRDLFCNKLLAHFPDLPICSKDSGKLIWKLNPLNSNA